MSIKFNELTVDYEYLVPNKIEGLIVIRIWQKIQANEIKEEFSYNDIRDTILEIAPLVLSEGQFLMVTM